MLYQFLTRLPDDVSNPFQATKATTTLKTAIEQIKIIMAVEYHTPVNPISTAQPKPTSEFHELKQQISELTAQVTALITCQNSSRRTPTFRENRPVQCFICSRADHLQYNCPTCRVTQDSVLLMVSKDMDGGLSRKKMARRWLPGKAVVPVSMSSMRNNAMVVKGKVGEVAVEIMLDTGSAVSLLHRKRRSSISTYLSSQGCFSINSVIHHLRRVITYRQVHQSI